MKNKTITEITYGLLIDTNQTGVGRTSLPKSPEKSSYTGYISKSEQGYPVMSISKGTIKDGIPIKAYTTTSAISQLKKIALDRYKKANNLHTSKSGIPVYYERD
jgi:hypothetical protein